MQALRTILLAVAFCSSALAFAQQAKPAADVLVFTNGDRLSGTLERAAGGSVVFKSDMAGEITVPFAKIKELTSAGSFVEIAEKPLRPPVTAPGPVTVADGHVTLRPDNAPERTLPVAQVGYLVDSKTYETVLSKEGSPLRGWTGSVTGGATLVRSTQTATTLTAGAALVRAIPDVPYLPPRNRTTVNLNESYGKQSTPVIPPTAPASAAVVVKTNIFHADAEFDKYFTRTVYVLADTNFDHNYSQGLALGQIYGGGFGWTVFKTDRHTFDVKADAHYEMQSFLSATPGVAPQASLNLFGSTFTETYLRTLPRKIVFTETANYIPSFTQTDAYSANLTTGLTIPVFKRLNASLSVVDNYLNDPAPFYRTNSFQFVTGITYNLR